MILGTTRYRSFLLPGLVLLLLLFGLVRVPVAHTFEMPVIQYVEKGIRFRSECKVEGVAEATYFVETTEGSYWVKWYSAGKEFPLKGGLPWGPYTRTFPSGCVILRKGAQVYDFDKDSYIIVEDSGFEAYGPAYGILTLSERFSKVVELFREIEDWWKSFSGILTLTLSPSLELRFSSKLGEGISYLIENGLPVPLRFSLSGLPTPIEGVVEPGKSMEVGKMGFQDELIFIEGSLKLEIPHMDLSFTLPVALHATPEAIGPMVLPRITSIDPSVVTFDNPRFDVRGGPFKEGSRAFLFYPEGSPMFQPKVSLLSEDRLGIDLTDILSDLQPGRVLFMVVNPDGLGALTGQLELVRKEPQPQVPIEAVATAIIVLVIIIVVFLCKRTRVKPRPYTYGDLN